MQFEPTEDQLLVVEGVAKVARSLRNSVSRRELEGAPDAQALTALRNLGAFGLLCPEAVGGLDADATTWTLALAELASADAGLALAVAEHGLAARTLAGAGSDARAKAAAQGRELGCLCLCGPRAHLDADGSDVTANAAADGWALTGATGWAALAARADFAVVRAGPDGGLFVVSLAAAGVARAGIDRQLGLRAAAGGTLQFDATPAQAVPGDASATFGSLRAWLALSTAAIAVGVAKAAAVAAGRYAEERIQFGAPISRLQPVQWHIANSAVDIDTAALLVGRAAALVDHDHKAKKALSNATLTAIWQAKTAAGTAATQVSDRAIQVHGGYGYTRDFPVERAYRDAALLQALHGTPSGLKVQTARLLAAQ